MKQGFLSGIDLKFHFWAILPENFAGVGHEYWADGTFTANGLFANKGI